MVRAAVCLCVLAAAAALDVPPAPEAPAPAERTRRPSALLRGLERVVGPPIQKFREAPPVTRSWVCASLALSVLTSQRVIDARSICFSEYEVLRRGEWWRLITNFFYMGDQIFSIFYALQIYHLWECLKMLELVKYHWEPSGLMKMIVGSAVLLLFLKQLSPSMIFLGSPMVLVFVYIYSRAFEQQVVSMMGFFQAKCSWLPFTQMAQDYLQTGDMMPNVLGLLAGHIYYYCSEVAPRMLLPKQLPPLSELLGSDPPAESVSQGLAGEGEEEEEPETLSAELEGADDAAPGDGADDDADDEGET